jgi:opacity protein-like surface antigen
MAYVTGGGAYIELEDFDDTGWVAGGGFEHKLRQNVSFGVEGLYYDFEGEDDFGDAAFWTARARLTYHFGGGRDSLR